MLTTLLKGGIFGLPVAVVLVPFFLIQQAPGIPTLDPSSTATVLAWVSTISVLASFSMFGLLMRSHHKQQSELKRRSAEERKIDRRLIIALITAISQHPEVEIDVNQIVLEVGLGGSSE